MQGTSGGDSRRASLEPPKRFWVFFRAAQGTVSKIRAFSPDCELDVGGLTAYWLGDARPEESVALLSSFVGKEEDESGRGLSRQAVAAIAWTDDASADEALENFTAPSQPEAVRKDVAFWLGAARGKRGFELLRRIVREDPSDSVRKQAVFALSISHEPEAVAALIDLARHDPNSGVRGQALFWLAHKAGQKAAQAITDAIRDDPETGVKKRAVFALTQLPSDEGLPLLIQVARDNRNPEVRRQAMFWLGQSKDPRAVSFFEEVLAH